MVAKPGRFQVSIIGLDWDDISIDVAKERQGKIESIEHISTLLFQTENGFHCELLCPCEVPVSEDFRIREKYWDDKRRLYYSKLRHDHLGLGHHDFLFSFKNGHGRRLIG